MSIAVDIARALVTMGELSQFREVQKIVPRNFNRGICGNACGRSRREQGQELFAGTSSIPQEQMEAAVDGRRWCRFDARLCVSRSEKKTGAKLHDKLQGVVLKNIGVEKSRAESSWLGRYGLEEASEGRILFCRRQADTSV